jgi:hypothetical protein
MPFGRLWAPFGLPLGGFRGLWETFGVTLDTFGRHCAHFCIRRLNQAKPRFCLEIRSSGALGGGHDALILTQTRPFRGQVDTSGHQHVHKGQPTPQKGVADVKEGASGRHQGPRTEKVKFPRVGGGAQEGQGPPQEGQRKPPHPPTPPLGRASSAHPPEQSL